MSTAPPRPTAHQRGYGAAWTKARAGYLRSHPHCAWCAEQGKREPAVHLHHTIPHRGDQAIFWNKANWIGLCQHHHNHDAQGAEHRGYRTAVDVSGTPVDPSHPFNRP